MKRGDIFYIADSDSIGHEQKKSRPGIIVSNDECNLYSPVVEVVYLTTSDAGFYLPTHVQIDSAPRPSTAKCEHIHSVDKSKLIQFIGKCTKQEIRNLNHALMISIGIGW